MRVAEVADLSLVSVEMVKGEGLASTFILNDLDKVAMLLLTFTLIL